MNRGDWIGLSFWDFLLVLSITELVQFLHGSVDWWVPTILFVAWLVARVGVFTYTKYYVRFVLWVEQLSNELGDLVAHLAELARSRGSFILLSFVLFLIIGLVQHQTARVLSALAQFMLLVSALQARKRRPIHIDHFDGGLVSWEHSPEVASLDSRLGNPPPSLRLSPSKPARPVWLRTPPRLRNLLLECDLLLDADSELGMVFRARDDASAWAQVNLLADYGGTDVHILEKVDGVLTIRASSDVDISSHTWVTVTCEVKDRLIRVEVNGCEVCKYQLLGQALQVGRLGFMAIQGAAHLDNVIVTTT